MKIISFINSNKEESLGLLLGNKVVDLELKAKNFMKNWDNSFKKAKDLSDLAEKGESNSKTYNLEDIKLISPIPNPPSCRDAYAFRQHVETARRNRGVDMIPEFDQFPIFYFTNHNAIFGPGDIEVEKDHLENLDFELEVAIVISQAGRNVKAEEADKHIAGLMIMNDLSARTLQMEEMKLSLGPAKGKDFATVCGPYLVTLDELEKFKVPAPQGHTGYSYDLEMKAFHNGKLVSQGNLKDMDWTFAEIIERASYGVELYPGDIIGSGTVGTGCYLELNGSARLEAQKAGKEFSPTWLQAGDEIELEVTGLGKLKNRIVLSQNDVSILAKKKC